MNIRERLFYLFRACLGSCMICLFLLVPGLVWPESMILFGLLAFIAFLYLVLPLHAASFLSLVYASLKYRVFTQVLSYYVYLVIWSGINAVIFQDFLFVSVPEKFQQWRYESKYHDELALVRVFKNDAGSIQTARDLIKKGVNPNIPDDIFGISALSWAAYRAKESDVELLINAGANINHSTSINFVGGANNQVQLSMATPLSLAGLNSDASERFQITSLLLEKGADARIGEPILGACSYSDLALLDILIRNGADLWVRDTKSKGCLYYAAFFGHLGLFDFLLEKQIGIDSLDQQTPSLVDIAASRGHTEIVLRFLEAGYEVTQPVRMERLLEKISVNAESKNELKLLFEKNLKRESK